MLLFHGSVIKFRQCEIKYMATKKAYVKYKKKECEEESEKIENFIQNNTQKVGLASRWF